MPRSFHAAGSCYPDRHYTLPPERRLPGLHHLIDRTSCFVLQAPRQAGKTTLLRMIAQSLTASGRYVAVHTRTEMSQATAGDAERHVSSTIERLARDAEILLEGLPPNHLPPPTNAALPPSVRLRDVLTRWALQCPRPVVILFDELDPRLDGPTSVLNQLLDGCADRPHPFPHCIGLVAVRYVDGHSVSLHVDAPDSPPNLNHASLTLRNFSEVDVAELYAQHTAETGQTFTPEALALAFHLTDGQPWLVNALARQLVEQDVTDRAIAIDLEHVNRAKEALIERRATHLHRLIEHLRKDRVRRVLAPMLAGAPLQGDGIDDDLAFVEDLGLVKRDGGHLKIANPIYREVIPRALSWTTQDTIPVPRAPFIDDDGRLRVDKILSDFVKFWKEHGEFLLAHQPYPEAAPHLVLMAFLQRVVNGGGFIDREYAVGSGRLDLCVRWPHKDGLQRFALELKVRTDKKNPLGEGLDQLAGYLRRLGLVQGTLVIFDRRTGAPPVEERGELQHEVHDGLNILVLWL